MAGFNVRNRFYQGSSPIGYGSQFSGIYSPFAAGALRGTPAGQQPQAQQPQVQQPQGPDSRDQMINQLMQMMQSIMTAQSQNTIRQDIQRMQGQPPGQQAQDPFEASREGHGGDNRTLPEGYVRGSDSRGNPILINLKEVNQDYASPTQKFKGLYQDPRAGQGGSARASSVVDEIDPGKLSPEQKSGKNSGGATNAPVIQVSAAEAAEIAKRPELRPLLQRLIALEQRGGLVVIPGDTVRGSIPGIDVRLGAPGGTAVTREPRIEDPRPRAETTPIVEPTPPQPINEPVPPPYVQPPVEAPQPEVEIERQPYVPQPIVQQPDQPPLVQQPVPQTVQQPYQQPQSVQTPSGESLESGGFSGAKGSDLKSPSGLGYLRPEMYGLEVTRNPFLGVNDAMMSAGPTIYNAPDPMGGPQFDEGSILAPPTQKKTSSLISPPTGMAGIPF